MTGTRFEWTPGHDTVINEAHARLGNKWTNIAKLLPSVTSAEAKYCHRLLQSLSLSDDEQARNHHRKVIVFAGSMVAWFCLWM